MKFIATVEDKHKTKIQQIAESLEQMGASVDQVLKITGIITGSSKSNSLEALKIKGIKTVEVQRRVKALNN